MLLPGQFTGYNYDMTSYKGAAKYALDSFEAHCQIAHEYCYEDIFRLTPTDLVDNFCPPFIFVDEDDDGVLERDRVLPFISKEMETLRNRLLKKGGAAIELSDYNGQEVDDLLLEKAFDFLISLEPEPGIVMSMEGYDALVLKNKPTVDGAMAVLRKYGEQIQPRTLEAMQEVYYELVTLGIGKYGSNTVWCSVAGSSLREAWDGLNGWMK